MTYQKLMGYALTPIMRRVRRKYYRFLERHYLICAEVEGAKAKQALDDQRVYQARAAIARSESHE